MWKIDQSDKQYITQSGPPEQPEPPGPFEPSPSDPSPLEPEYEPGKYWAFRTLKNQVLK